MGMVMVKCPQTGHAIPTGIKTDSESFGRRAVFFSRTRCPICRTDHAWFAREAWVDEPGIRAASWRVAPDMDAMAAGHDAAVQIIDTCAQPDRTVLQQDHAMSSCRDPI